jgi:phage head maturation protease
MFPVGVSTDWDSKKDGLYGTWRLDESDDAQRAARLARDGFLRWFSVGISPIRSEWTYVADDEWDPPKGPEHMDRVRRTEARLLETSLVTTPAFATAQVKLVHSETAPPPGRVRRPRLAAWQAYRAGLDG